MKIFFTERITTLWCEIGSYALYIGATAAVHLLTKIPLLVLITNILTLFIIALNYKSNLRKRISSVLLFFMITACVEIIVASFTMNMNINITKITATINYDSFIGLTICRIIIYLVVLILSNFKNSKTDITMPLTYWVSVLIIPIGTLVLLFLILSDEIIFISNFFVLSAVIIILLINIVAIFLYDSIAKFLVEKIHEKEVERQNQYNAQHLSLMGSSMLSTDILYHDMKQHVAYLQDLLENDKKEDALQYLSVISDKIDKSKYLVKSGNFSVDSVVNFKLQNADKQNIKVTTDICIPSEFGIDSFDIVAILGNLLDNALEGVKTSKDKWIRIEITFDKGVITMQIQNSFDGIVRMDGESFVTKKADRDKHGFGIKSVKETVEKYNGDIQFENNETTFTVELLLYPHK